MIMKFNANNINEMDVAVIFFCIITATISAPPVLPPTLKASAMAKPIQIPAANAAKISKRGVLAEGVTLRVHNRALAPIGLYNKHTNTLHLSSYIGIVCKSGKCATKPGAKRFEKWRKKAPQALTRGAIIQVFPIKLLRASKLCEAGSYKP